MWIIAFLSFLLLIVTPGTVGIAGAATTSQAVAATPHVGPTVSGGPFVAPAKALGSGYETSADQVAFGSPSPAGYNVYVARSSGKYAPHLVASLSMPGFDTPEWIGYFCQSADGSYGMASFAPLHFINATASRLGMGYLAIIDLRTGTSVITSERVALTYNALGCGVSDIGVATSYQGADGETTVASTVDLRSAHLLAQTRIGREITSIVPAQKEEFGIEGTSIGEVTPSGSFHDLTRVATGTPFELTPGPAGSLEFLTVSDGSSRGVVAWQLQGTTLHRIGSASSAGAGLFLGRDGLDTLAGAGASSNDPSALDVLVTGAKPLAVALGGSVAVDQPVTGGRGASTLTAGFIAGRTGATGTASLPGGGAKASVVQATATDGRAASQQGPTCAIPRLDYKTQVFQTSDEQNEWAADQATLGTLTNTVPANYQLDNEPAFQPQKLIPPVALDGGSGTIPAQILLGILAQESNFDQASYHAIAGVSGDPLIADYYGTGGALTGINYTAADCGYGIGQVTDGMQVGETTPWSAEQQRLIAVNFEANIAASVQILDQTWNELQTPSGVVTFNGGNPAIIEDWYFAVWAYNTGYHPFTATGSPYGVGWANNPANPVYPVNRDPFMDNSGDASVPGDWPYQERVIGWARHSQDDFVTGELKFAPLSPDAFDIPSENTFCSPSVNNCTPGGSGLPGTCGLSNDECWWHGNMAWAAADESTVVTYPAGSAEPANPTDPYPPVCGVGQLPGGAVVVDNVPNTSWNVVGCGSRANPGTFSFGSSPPDSLIDFHQLGVGYGGHSYFAHTVAYSDADHTVTGTWTPPSSVGGYNQIFVQIPPNGADTAQAPYVVSTGASSETRVVNQRWNANEWVSLGVFNLTAGKSSVSLSNATYQDWTDGEVDISYTAVAFVPTSKQSSYVAMGDSYSAGEGLQPFYPNSDVASDGALPKNACHRSETQAYPEAVASYLGVSDFHFLACSGATTPSIDPTLTSPGAFVGPWGEVPQLVQGYLDASTTYVTLTIGGNDARFADVLKGCIATLTNCTDSNYYLTTPQGVDPQPLIQYEPKVINGLLGPLETVFADMRAYAPNATIVVGGYPHLLPDTNSEAEAECPTDLLNLPSDAQWLNSMADLLDSVISKAASTEGVRFADPRPTFEGHDACAASPYLNALIAYSSSGSGTTVPGAGSFHPTAKGAQEYAKVFEGSI